MKLRVLASVLVTIWLAGCNDGGSSYVDTTTPDTDFQSGLKSVRELYLLKEGERSDSIYEHFFNRIHADAQKYADSIEFDMDDELWPDLPQATTDVYSRHFSAIRLKKMSQAYITPGPMYLNDVLLKKISIGLEQYLNKFYKAGATQDGNWYEWQIGVPQELMQLVANLDGYMRETLKAKVIASVRTYLLSIDNVNTFPAPGYSTGSNRVDQAWSMMIRGFATQNLSDIETAKKAFFDSAYNRYAAYENADSSSPGAYRYGTIDSFKRDGSYVLHVDIPYSNGYGLDLLNRSAEMLIMLNGTKFDFTLAEKNIILNDAFDRVEKAYMPWLKDGMGLDATAGRAVFRGFEQGHGKGKWAIEGILKYYELAGYGNDPVVNAKRKKLIAKFAKSFLTNDSLFYSNFGANSDEVNEHDIEYYATEATSIKLAKKIMADSDVNYIKQPLKGNLIFPEMDRVVHRMDNFSFAVASHSYRTGNYEIVGGEGARGCYSADGMTYLYDDDLDQYMNYWVSFDADRPAGVTNDGSSPVDASQCGWSAQTGRARKASLRWSGGASAGNEGFGVFGMDYKDWHWTGSRATPTPFVEAKKSWFMFGDTILALGSDIKCNVGCDRNKLETTIDNRKLASNASYSVLINGDPWQENSQAANVRTVHITGNIPSSRLGIVFPSAASIDVTRESRSGDWKYLSNRGTELMKSTFAENDFLRTTINHKNTSDDSYAYVLLPGKTSSQTMEYAEHPTLRVLIKDKDIHAIHDAIRDVYAMNVFAAPSSNYVSTSSSLIRGVYTENGNINAPVSASVAEQLFNLSANEIMYGADGYVKSTGAVSLMSQRIGDELTVWVSQPTRNVMSAVLDVSSSGYTLTDVLAGNDNITLSSDGKKALVKFDLMLIGQANLTGMAFEASGQTYKLRFKVMASNNS